MHTSWKPELCFRPGAASRNEKATNPPEPEPQLVQSDVQTSNIHPSASALQS